MRCGTGCCEATALAAGARFTCARASDGSVSCWGANDGGQLGDGTTSARAVPGSVALPGRATAIGAGVTHACAVLEGGAVRCWGSNAAGQISGTPAAAPSLAAAATPVTSGAVAVVAGASHTCALLEAGAVRCWGAPAQAGGGVPVAVGATAVAAGRDHTCAVVGGAVLCWGENDGGELGNGGTAASVAPVSAGGIGGIQLLAAGSGQTCAATGTSNGQELDDAIRCWGDSLGDSLGGLVPNAFGFASPQPSPEIPRKDAGRSTIDHEVGLVAVGRKHVCVRDRAEAVECFGANDSGQLGGTPTGPTEAVTVQLRLPIEVPPAPTPPIASAIAAGADHTCAIVRGGRLRCWGANESGQLGNGSTENPAGVVEPLGR
jgi:alpha-tubulin suppressor-like RCC1 family protein